MFSSYKPSPLYFQKYRDHRPKQKVTASVLEFSSVVSGIWFLICEFFHHLIHSAISLIWVEVLRIVRTVVLSYHGAPITEFVSVLFATIAEVNNIFIILYLFYRRYESSKKWKYEWFGINEPMDAYFVLHLA